MGKTVTLVPQSSQLPQQSLKIVKETPEILKLKKDISTYYPRTLKQTSKAETIAKNKAKVDRWESILLKDHGIKTVFNPHDSSKKRVEYLPIDTKTTVSLSDNRLERSV